MKTLTQIQLCFLLLITFLEKAQQVTATNDQGCKKYQYFHETLGKCCSRCNPGKYLKKHCNETSDSDCQNCKDGYYSASWNFAENCRPCRPCAPHLVEKEKCSSDKKEVCVCPEGSNCTQYDGVGTCLVCMSTFTTMPPGPSVSQMTPVYPVWITPTIFVVGIIVSVALIILFVRHKSLILNRLGCMSKVKKPLPETGGLEFIVSPSINQGLLLGKELHYPMEETDPRQSSECALNSISSHLK